MVLKREPTKLKAGIVVLYTRLFVLIGKRTSDWWAFYVRHIPMKYKLTIHQLWERVSWFGVRGGQRMIEQNGDQFSRWLNSLSLAGLLNSVFQHWGLASSDFGSSEAHKLPAWAPPARRRFRMDVYGDAEWKQKKKNKKPNSSSVPHSSTTRKAERRAKLWGEHKRSALVPRFSCCRLDSSWMTSGPGVDQWGR